MSVASAISLRGVVKRFGDVTAVDGLDLDVPEGVCFGLLGPNGAGKSTTMRMLTGQARATTGEISVLGRTVPGDSRAARRRMGVCPQQDNLDVELTVRQTLDIATRLYGVPRAKRAAAIDRALQVARLADRADDNVTELSGGMRRRLLIGRALVHQPDLVLLDEPTVGLDPQIRQELWTVIDTLRSDGVTVLMSTHYIEEAERLADIVAVMAGGKVVARGTPSTLVAEHAGAQAVEVYGSPTQLQAVQEQADTAGWSTRRSGPAVVILGVESLDAAALPDGERRPTNLEDAFVVLTGQEID